MKDNNDIQPQAEPYIVKSHDIHIDNDYADWIADIKSRYRSAQAKAAVKVNAEKLLFNWQLGRDLVQKKAEERWGAGVVEQVSLDLKREFPDADGFSVRNLWYMKQWYLFYTQGEEAILHQLGAEIQKVEKQYITKMHQAGAELNPEKLHQVGGEFPMPFALVPWRHHVEIITKCKSIDEALFYVGKTIEQGLSRDALINCIKANLYEHQGKIVNNFTDHLPALQSKLVQEVLKENYDFGFATVEHEIYDEAELEEALTKNVTDLLLELGTGFAFLGRQKELVVGGRSRKIDLLFYHIRLRCYIVCELKAKPFEPEFAGKLNYYVNAVDELLKTDDENPTIGLLVCSDMDKIDVQWSFKGISTPMGVATYNNIRIKDALPSQEQLAERVRLLQKELQETKRLKDKVATSASKIASSSKKVATSEQKDATSTLKVATLKKKVSSEEMAIYILEYCDTWRSMDEIVQFSNRDKNYIRNKVLPKLAEKLEKEYPDIPNHPQQRYRTKPKDSQLS